MRDYEILRKALMDAWRDQDCNECVLLCEDEAPCYFKQAADAIEELLDELTTIRKQLPHWISVEERLPPVYKNVLSCDKYGLVKENYMISDKSWSVGYHITHWMPLPAPPKGVE